jgi:hypothetical protein
MPKTLPLILLVIVVLAGGVYVSHFLPGEVATGVLAILLAFSVLILAVRLGYMHFIPDFRLHAPRLHVWHYVCWLLQSHHQRMDISSFRGEPDAFRFDRLFCDLSSYLVEQRPMRLSSWLAQTQEAGKATGAILLGPPGGGKSVSLRAILLSCANSYFFCHLVPGFLRQGERGGDLTRRVSKVRARFRFLFDSTWLFGAPPLVPILVPLRDAEAHIAEYAESQKTAHDAETVFEKILEIHEGLDLREFYSLLGEGRIALLLDGVDELTTEGLREAALDLAGKVHSRGASAPNLVLVTCRKGSYTEQLRERTPRVFEHVEIGELNNEDRRAIVQNIIRAVWRRADPIKGNTFIARAKREFGRKQGAWTKVRFRRRLCAREKLIGELVHEIIDLFSRAFSGSAPTSNPLSLRRITTVLLSRTSGGVRYDSDPYEKPRWRVELAAPAESLDYTSIIEIDLVEYVNRRRRFCDNNQLTIPQFLSLYGELAYQCLTAKPDTNHAISDEDLRKFVQHNSRAPQSESNLPAQIAAFLEPGIMTLSGPTDAGSYRFRDEESERFLIATYMLASSVGERIDQFIGTVSDCDPAFSAGTLQMVFARLQLEAFDGFVAGTKHFRRADILQGLVSGQTGGRQDGAISPRNGVSLLQRCLRELRTECSNSESIRMWILLRHLVFRTKISHADLVSDLIEMLDSSAATAENKAQALLVLAEIAKFFERERSKGDIGAILSRCVRDGNSLIACCAAAGYQLLFPSGSDESEVDAKLWLSVPAGNWELGSPGWPYNMPRRMVLPSFKIARFPVLVYQAARCRGKRDDSIRPGEAFWPAAGLDAREVREIAVVAGGRLPVGAEYEVVAAYTGSNGRRRYPWGDSFDQQHVDLGIWEREFRRLLGTHGDPLPVALKPLLATPSGVYDLVANVIQLSSDETHRRSGVDLAGFGLSQSKDMTLYACAILAPIAADHRSPEVGFRLARDR